MAQITRSAEIAGEHSEVAEIKMASRSNGVGEVGGLMFSCIFALEDYKHLMTE